MLFKRIGRMCVLIIIASTSALSAQTSLNQIVSPEKGTKEHYYDLNESALLSQGFVPGSHFTFEMQPGVPTEFILSKKQSYVPGTISFIAREAKDDREVLSFTYSQGRINGLYHRSHTEAMVLGYQPEKGQNYVSDAAENVNGKLECGLGADPQAYTPLVPTSTTTGNGQRAKSSGSYSYSPAPLYASEEDSITIDVMIVYTNAAEAYATTSSYGNIDALIAQAFTLSQTALDNSLTGVEIRLVYAHKTTYDEETDGVDSDARLRRLTQNPNNPVFDSADGYDGYMEEIHPLRDQYGADVVAMFALIDDTGGLGWRLSSTGGNPAFAFNINRVQQVAGSYTMIHEVGHNMGNAHSRTQQSSAADDSGGLFHYSAGFQDMTNNFHTIMAYADGLSEAPLFSSPDLTWQGDPAGSTNVQRPMDNAKSMKIIKRTVASYRPTEVQAPSAALSTNSITVEMNREDQLSVPVDITNSGQSGLIWSADFDFTSQTVAKNKTSSNRLRIEPIVLEDQDRMPANYSGDEMKGRAKLAETILYDTSFETGDGFFTGNYTGRAHWHSLNSTEFSISGTNPQTGSQHLRLAYDGTSTKFIASPFLGYQLFGSYEVTLSFSVTDLGETYDIYVKDGKTGDFSAGIIISQQTIFAADMDETNGMGFFGTGATVTPNVYRTLKIVYNVTNQTIDYYYAGSLIAQNSYINGFTPGVVQVLHRNTLSGAAIDVDDLQVKRIAAPYPWLDVPQMTGVALEQETKPITLDFNTYGINAGTYETMLTVRTNDPANPQFDVPVTLTVNDVVPNEKQDLPGTLTLDQNYPNPFNPSTTISYTLNEAQEVKLDVYTIQGRKVATLQKGRMGAGSHRVTFDATELSSGVYVYRLETATQTLTRQMVLIK